MSEEKDQNGGSWSKVPTWDGSPQTWRSFQREMMWWQSALDLESTKKYNLAARWLLRQSGVVRQRGEEFTPEELAYQKEVKGTDPESGQELVLVAEDPLMRFDKIVESLGRYQWPNHPGQAWRTPEPFLYRPQASSRRTDRRVQHQVQNVVG